MLSPWVIRFAVVVCSTWLCGAGLAAPGDAQTLYGTITSIDVRERLLELRTGSRAMTLRLEPEVVEVTRLQPGMPVLAHYHDGRIVRLGKTRTAGANAGASAPAAARMQSAASAAPGAEISATVHVTAIDRNAGSITFTGPAGMIRTLGTEEPQTRALLAALHEGEQVDVTFVDARADMVHPKSA